MEKELDLSIARLIKEYREQEEAQERERVRKQYDPKERITYTLEELTEGIRSGRQMLYLQTLEFEPRPLLEGRITIPYIKDFFDIEDNESETALFVSNKQKAAFSLAASPCGKPEQSVAQWIARTREDFRKMNWSMKPEQGKSMGNMQYFCFVMPTPQGRLYNVMYRFYKDGRLYAGVMNCPEEERRGMGLLLEAMVHVIQEMND